MSTGLRDESGLSPSSLIVPGPAMPPLTGHETLSAMIAPGLFMTASGSLIIVFEHQANTFEIEQAPGADDAAFQLVLDSFSFPS